MALRRTAMLREGEPRLLHKSESVTSQQREERGGREAPHRMDGCTGRARWCKNSCRFTTNHTSSIVCGDRGKMPPPLSNSGSISKCVLPREDSRKDSS